MRLYRELHTNENFPQARILRLVVALRRETEFPELKSSNFDVRLK